MDVFRLGGGGHSRTARQLHKRRINGNNNTENTDYLKNVQILNRRN